MIYLFFEKIYKNIIAQFSFFFLKVVQVHKS